MKTVRQLLSAIVLTLTIAVSSFAGNMHTTAPAPPPDPPPADGGTSATVSGNIHTGYTDEATAGDVVAEAALSLLQGVLALL